MVNPVEVITIILMFLIMKTFQASTSNTLFGATDFLASPKPAQREEPYSDDVTS